MTYKEFTIPKKNGKARKVCAPDAELLKYQRKALYMIQGMYKEATKDTSIENVAHGFIRGRNVVTAAKQHIGYRSTIMMDISNFFDTVYKSMLPPALQDVAFYHKEGYAAQGFATSPLIANYASIGMLNEIKDNLDALKIKYAFTIYADDLQISTNSEVHEELNGIIDIVSQSIRNAGFGVNVKKTRIKYAKFGYRRILGVNVGDSEVRATRKVMRKIRAARHQNKKSSLGGLVNWSRCHEPKKKVKKNKRTIKRGKEPSMPW